MQISFKSLFPVFLFMCMVAIVATNCKKEDENSCDTTSMSYKDDVKPLLTSKGCLSSGCHSAADGNNDYTTYAKLKAVVDANRLIGSIKRSAGFSAMPKGGDKLDDCSISKIEAWVTQGAKDN